MRRSLFDLTGKVALVTGATRGIGLAIAEEFASAGASVVISSNEADNCESVAARMRRDGHAVTGIPCDVIYRRELEDLVRASLDLQGRIDILVCNAGVAPHGGPIASASDVDWDSTMTVNLRSVLWLTSLVIPGMPTQRIHDPQMHALRKAAIDAGLNPSMDPFREFFVGRNPA